MSKSNIFEVVEENGKKRYKPLGGGGGGSIDVDDTLDTESTNPIQNQAVAKEFEKVEEAKADKTQIEELSNRVSDNWNNGSYNLIPYPYANNSYTNRGITFTSQNNGNVIANGKVSETTLDAFVPLSGNFTLKAGTYCIMDGVGDSSDTKYWCTVYNASTNAEIVRSTRNNGIFTIAEDTTVYLQLRVYRNTTISNLVFKPMLVKVENGSYPTEYQRQALGNAELTDYANTQSNPNLLDNPFFTVNQRGQSSYKAGLYGADRWYVSGDASTDGYAEFNENGAKIISGTKRCWIYQRISEETAKKLYGKTITFSVMLSNGEIYSATSKAPTSKPSSSSETTNAITDIPNTIATALFWLTNGIVNAQIAVSANSSVEVKAMKLELGSISTLANDVPPDYTTELLKCQRYFVRLGVAQSGANYNFGFGFANTSTSANMKIPLPTKMRTNPTITYNINPRIASNNSSKEITAISSIYLNGGFGNLVTLICTTSGLTAGNYCEFRTEGGYVDLSADL